MNLRLAILAGLFIPSFASAAMKTFAVNEATASAVETAGDGAITVFGGWAGACSGSTLSTCDSCATLTTLGARAECNERSIHDSLLLEVSFTIDAAPPAGSSIIAKADDTTISVAEKSTTLTAGTTLYARISWTQLCGGSCTSSPIGKPVSLRVGVSNGSDTSTFSADKTISVNIKTLTSPMPFYTPCNTEPFTPVAGEGFCWFEMTPGDEKAYFNRTGLKLGRSDINHSGGPAEIKFKYLRVYAADATLSADFSGINPAEAIYQDFLIQNMASVKSGVERDYIDGLVNDTTYMFAIATVDQAENVFSFSNPAIPQNDTTYGTMRVAKPQEVYGLLEKQSCFIATAAYGHQWDPQVNILRQFRNNFLLTNPIGTAFVKFYYAVSPPIANFIATNETLKTMVRRALSPVVWLSEKMNQMKEKKSQEKHQETHD